jgi:hypothetical protein
MGFLSRARACILLLLACCFVPVAFAQTDQYYEYDNYDPGQSYKFGVHGTLFNSQPKLLTDVQTTFNGLQDVWTTAYLPFAVQEYGASFPLELFGPHYTTGIALASPKDPSLGLYAPVQVRAVTASVDNPGAILGSALAKDLPIGGSTLNIQGPFNTLSNLNKNEPSFANSEASQNGVSILAAAQQFTRFGHTILTDINGVGWNGFDKEGKLTISLEMTQGAIPGVLDDPHYSPIDRRIIIPHTENVKRQTIGHEIAHGILAAVYGSDQYNNSIERSAIEQGFAEIIGHSFRLWMSPGKFLTPDWVVEKESIPPGFPILALDNPKKAIYPSTYLGIHYQTDPLFAANDNGYVLGSWFTMIVDGRKGFSEGGRPFIVEPLIPGDRDASFKLALRILFSAFTTKLTPATGYPALRAAIAATAIEFGYPVNSHVYKELEKAWIASGVGTDIEVSTCFQTMGESLINGDVPISVKEGTLILDSSGEKVTALLDCFGGMEISTADEYENCIVDWDNDQIYSENNSELESKIAVAVHAFTKVAKDWFTSNLGIHGVDGINQCRILNVIGDPQYPEGVLKKPNKIFKIFYPLNGKWTGRDDISRNYFRGITYFSKEVDIPESELKSEWVTIKAGLANIFALEIKRDYEKANGNFEALNLWTIHEELSDPTRMRDFSDPKLYGQPSLYNGDNWISDNPGHNTGFFNLFYYLLAHGTADELGQDFGYSNIELPGKIYFVNKQDKKLILQVLWQAYRSTALNASIEEFRMATMTALHQLDPVKYHPKSKEHIAFYDAWAAVLGLGDYASTLAHFPEDDAVVYPWAAKVGVEVEYPLYESYRLFEVSTSAAFNENVAPVYRFMNSQAPDLATGMTYGYINLEPGKYFVRSHLAQGPESRAHCESSDDPAFCESLLGRGACSCSCEHGALKRADRSSMVERFQLR